MLPGQLQSASLSADKDFGDNVAGDVVVPCPLKNKKPPEGNWLAIELIDVSGNPAPNEPYVVVLPGGKRLTGQLDEAGRARITDLEQPGQCRVIFPNRDPAWWQPAPDEQPPEEEKSQAEPVSMKLEPVTWLEVEVVFDDGTPAAFEPFRLTPAVGQPITGELDETGYARVEGIGKGKCKVTFPGRDDAWWQSGKDDEPPPPPEKGEVLKMESKAEALQTDESKSEIER